MFSILKKQEYLLEPMEKNKYLEYFSQSQQNNQNFNRFHDVQKKNIVKNQTKNQSVYCNSKKDSKPLPHISEEYQYKITNQLLLFKIMNPKRDKLIMESFHRSCSRPQTKKKGHLKRNSSLDRPITKEHDLRIYKDQTLPMPGSFTPQQKLKRSILFHKAKGSTGTKGSKSYQKQFNLILQNERMGKRIVNTKSSVEESLKKTFYTYKNQSKQNINLRQTTSKSTSHHSQVLKNSNFKIHNHNNHNRENKGYLYASKINSGVKVFFNNVVEEQKLQNSHHKSHFSENSSCHTERKVKESEQCSGPQQNQLKPNSITIYNEQKRPIQKIIQYPSDFDQTKSIIMPSNQFRSMSKTCQSKKRFVKQSFQNSRIFQSLHKQQKQNSNINNCDLQFETHFPESFKLFGHGPTILMIYNFEIKCNPKLKDDSLLLFELITHQRRINLFKTKQKTIRTTPICYDYLRCQADSLNSNSLNLNSLKFCINVSQIGDFIPLRVYKINGVQLQELGIIDIDLSPYKYRKTTLDDIDQSQNLNQTLQIRQQDKKQSQADNKDRNRSKQKQSSQKNNLIKEIRLNQSGQKLQRDVVYGKIHTKLRKRRLAEVDIEVSLLYKIYSKKFKNSSETAQ